MATASPYNNRIELIARGWHASRDSLVWVNSLGESHASSPMGAALPRSPFGPCSQFIRTLYAQAITKMERHEKQ